MIDCIGGSILLYENQVADDVPQRSATESIAVVAVLTHITHKAEHLVWSEPGSASLRTRFFVSAYRYTRPSRLVKFSRTRVCIAIGIPFLAARFDERQFHFSRTNNWKVFCARHITQTRPERRTQFALEYIQFFRLRDGLFRLSQLGKPSRHLR